MAKFKNQLWSLDHTIQVKVLYIRYVFCLSDKMSIDTLNTHVFFLTFLLFFRKNCLFTLFLTLAYNLWAIIASRIVYVIYVNIRHIFSYNWTFFKVNHFPRNKWQLKKSTLTVSSKNIWRLESDSYYFIEFI